MGSRMAVFPVVLGEAAMLAGEGEKDRVFALVLEAEGGSIHDAALDDEVGHGWSHGDKEKGKGQKVRMGRV